MSTLVFDEEFSDRLDKAFNSRLNLGVRKSSVFDGVITSLLSPAKLGSARLLTKVVC